MQRQPLMRRCRNATWKTWLGGALAVWLLLAESFAVVHAYDSAAHSNGQLCAVCVTAASFSSAAVGAPVQVDVAVATPIVVFAVVFVVFAAVPTRRYARGPPARSFTF
jgi:hypothetical protein